MGISETPSERRQRQIDALRPVAAALHAQAKHESIKSQVALAERDLNEAGAWLREKNIDTRPAMLQIVDFTLQLADSRLKAVRNALDLYGPDAMVIG